MQTAKLKKHLPIFAIVALGFLLRLALVVVTDGYDTDVSCFSAWALRMADVGPKAFYAPDYFADYPPGYMLVLWLLGEIAGLFHLSMGSNAFLVLLQLIPMLCDAAIAVVVWRISAEATTEKGALVTAAMVAFCPALLYNTGVWKQVDSVFILVLLLVFWLLNQKKYLPAALLFGLALAIKPQALLYGPVLAVCFAVPLLSQKKFADISTTIRNAALGAVAALGVVFVAGVPFASGFDFSWLIDKYFGTMESYPYASVNAFNFIGLLGGNWAHQDSLIGGLFSWKTLGTVGILLSTAVLLWLAWVSAKNNRFCPFLLAGFYGAAIFTFSHRMHERYLLPAIVLVLVAAVRWNSKGLFGAFCAFTTSSFLNMAVVLTCYKSGEYFLDSNISLAMVKIGSFIEVCGMLLLLYSTVIIALGDDDALWTPGKAKLLNPAKPKSQPVWTSLEAAFLVAVTMAVMVLSVWDLGDTTAPQNALDVTDFAMSEQVVLPEAPTEIRIYPGINWDGSVVLFDETGTQVAEKTLNWGTTFTWSSIGLTDLAPGRYTVEVNTAQVVEIAFWGERGQIMVTDSDSALFDEQTLCPETLSYRNSMYFDEIYHGRTAYEHLHGLPVYETTHPPLGKVFIMLGIALFGMTGFGWRIAGVMFGVAMVPVLYLFVRRLTRNRKAAGFAALLVSLDLMRLAQTRIATIDVYGTFFILLSAYFMLWFCQSLLQKGFLDSLWPLFFSGLCFGLGAASKWTGIYAGAGLAVVYFAALYLRYLQKEAGFSNEFLGAISFGVLFFVVVPFVVYYASYIPFYWRENGFSLNEFWAWQKNMYDYHKNLEATHGFESRWYSWPFALRPVWYYAGSVGAGKVASIAGMANPVVWVSGICAVGGLLWKQLSGKGGRRGLMVLVFFFTQLIPWMFVTRCTFMYHYFPSLLFSLVALAFLLSELDNTHPKLATGIGCAILVLAAIAFVWLYPAATGMTVSVERAKSMLWLDSWGFYIL